MHSPASNRRRGRVFGAGLAAAALVASSALTAVGSPADQDLGVAVDTPAVSIEEQLAAYGDRVLPNRWLVQLNGITGQQLVKSAQQQGVKVKVNKQFDKLWKGVSVDVDDNSVEKLAGISGVAGVFPVLTVERPVEDASPTMAYATQMTGADVAQSELGLTGKGIKVGIIDSGIDYNHPDFGGSGVNDETKDFPGKRVQYGYDLVGDAYDSREDATSTPKPDAFPDDCGGHGSHVAGIVGANGEIVGVAPEVTFGAYRVFGCDGSSDSEVIIEAMERAYADGMDVVNMSLGASYATWPSYPTAVAADKLVERGVTVVVSQGNEGTGGTFSGGAPSVAHNVISVGSVDNTNYMASYLETEAGAIAISGATGSPEFEPGATYPLVKGTPLNACQPLTPATAPGQAVLIQRGDCTFHAKAVAAQEAGYAAVVLANNTTGIINATVEGDTEITIPVGTILKADGDRLLALLEANATTTITVGTDVKSFPNPTGGLQSDFSSYGLAADLTLKPDVSAPGGSIYSTVPLEIGGYESMGGTSMAAPHVSGAVALLLEAKPGLDPFAVRTTLTNTADPFVWSGNPALGLLEPVHRQGGGLIDIPQAVTTDVAVTESKISLGEGEAGPVTTTLTITNSSDRDRTYTLDSEHGLTTYGATSTSPRFLSIAGDVQLSAESVTVPAGGSATFTATIGEDFGVDGAIYGGWVTLSGDGDELRVPFAGISGDYQGLTAMPYAYLVHYDAEADGLDFSEPFRKFSMVGQDVPGVFFDLTFPVQQFYMDVYRATPDGEKGEKVHSNFINYATFIDQGRLKSATMLPWDGTYQGNNGKNGKVRRVADGDYVLEIRVLKALGDPSNPEHWEQWVSPAFTVAYGEGAETGAGNGPTAGKSKKRG